LFVRHLKASLLFGLPQAACASIFAKNSKANPKMPSSKSLLSKIFDTETFFEKVLALWRNYHGDEVNWASQYLEKNTFLLERMAQDKYSVYAIFDHLNFKLLYVGKNAEEFSGYTAEEFKERGMRLVFKLFKKEHLFFFINLISWSKTFRTKFHAEIRTVPASTNICGLSFTHKSGRHMRVFLRTYPLEVTESGFFAHSLVEIVDLTHLIKSGGYWMHFSIGQDSDKKSMSFFSENKKGNGTELLTERELEILKLVADGLPTTEIAERLFISPATVEKHRKNMVARLGVRDMMALVEICRRCGIL
jgi:DNA-binding CsgD family transcriptional regulator